MPSKTEGAPPPTPPCPALPADSFPGHALSSPDDDLEVLDPFEYELLSALECAPQKDHSWASGADLPPLLAHVPAAPPALAAAPAPAGAAAGASMPAAATAAAPPPPLHAILPEGRSGTSDAQVGVCRCCCCLRCLRVALATYESRGRMCGRMLWHNSHSFCVRCSRVCMCLCICAQVSSMLHPVLEGAYRLGVQAKVCVQARCCAQAGFCAQAKACAQARLRMYSSGRVRRPSAALTLCKDRAVYVDVAVHAHIRPHARGPKHGCSQSMDVAEAWMKAKLRADQIGRARWGSACTADAL